eukprot:3933620-Rhodomonas_salina.1
MPAFRRNMLSGRHDQRRNQAAECHAEDDWELPAAGMRFGGRVGRRLDRRVEGVELGRGRLDCRRLLGSHSRKSASLRQSPILKQRRCPTSRLPGRERERAGPGRAVLALSTASARPRPFDPALDATRGGPERRIRRRAGPTCPRQTCRRRR